MKSNWKKVKLSDICDVRDGTHDSPKRTAEGRFLITSKHIKGGKIDLSSAYKISLKDFDMVNQRSKVDQWDILLSMIGTIGEVCIVKEEPDFAIKNVGLIKTNDEILSLYLYYYLKTPTAQSDILARLKGTTQQYLSLGEIRSFPISIPQDDRVMRKITKILSSIDDKIELNNKINRNLEAQAQAIFKSWFIDFEPFKNGKFIDSELGKIPEGWDIGTIGDISIISTGKRPDKKSVNKSNETPIPIIGASSIMGYTNKALYNDKILITGRVGTHGIIQKIDSPCWPSDNTLVLRSKNLNFLHNCLLLINWKSMNRGSTQPLITQNDLKNTRIILPQDKIIQNYEQLVHYFDIKFHNNNKEIYALSQICDLLLPKLMSGEVNISDYIA